MVRQRSQLPRRRGHRRVKTCNFVAHFSDTIRMAIHRMELANLSGSQQDLMGGEDDSPLSTPILGRSNTSECCTPHSTPSSHHISLTRTFTTRAQHTHTSHHTPHMYVHIPHTHHTHTSQHTHHTPHMHTPHTTHTHLTPHTCTHTCTYTLADVLYLLQ